MTFSNMLMAHQVHFQRTLKPRPTEFAALWDWAAKRGILQQPSRFINHQARCLLDNMSTEPVLRGFHEAAAFTGSKTVSVDSALDPFGSHRGVRVCARGVGDSV